MITKYRAPGLSHCVPFFVSFFLSATPEIQILQCSCSENDRAPSNRRNNTRRLSLFISLSFFSFSPPPPPVILVALSMDFNVDCNKLWPREVVRTWERWVESSRVESPLFLRPRLFLTRLNAPLDDDKFTGVAGELIVPRFRATIYQRHLRLIDNWRIFPNRFGVNVIKFSFFVSVPFARSVENKKKENGETKCLFQKK